MNETIIVAGKLRVVSKGSSLDNKKMLSVWVLWSIL